MQKLDLHLDLHMHTVYSKDSVLSLKTLAKLLKRYNLHVAITDHNTIKGALAFKKRFRGLGNRIIIGEEVKTLQGEVIGLFLQDQVKPFMDVFETVDNIRSQDGLVLIPHPFDRLRRSRLKPDFLLRIKPDIFEVFNSRTLFEKYNIQALRFARNHNLLMGVGSDAHYWFEVGSCFALVEDCSSPRLLLKSLKNPRFVIHRNLFKSLMAHGFSKFLKTFPTVKRLL